MVTNKVTPANTLALYTWEVLKRNTSMQLINGLIPVVPIDDEPRFHDADAAYIIYGYSEQFSNGPREIRSGIMSFRICARTTAELGEITTTISRTFEGGDIPAAHVNGWSSTVEPLIGIRFTSLETSYVEGGEGENSEGGPVYGMVNVRYDYVSHQKVIQFQSNGTWA